MKLTIWIRTNAKGETTLRTDYKLESGDTPFIQRHGFHILDAVEGKPNGGMRSGKQ